MGTIFRMDCPIISAAVKPNRRSAAGFQDRTVPSRSLLMITSSDEATMAPRCSAASAVCSAARDLSADLRSADHASLGVADRRRRHRQFDPLPVLARRARGRGRAAFAVQNPHERGGFLALAFGREQQGDLAADDLRGGVSEQAFRRGIPRCDAALAIVADDRIVAESTSKAEGLLGNRSFRLTCSCASNRSAGTRLRPSWTRLDQDEDPAGAQACEIELERSGARRP